MWRSTKRKRLGGTVFGLPNQLQELKRQLPYCPSPSAAENSTILNPIVGCNRVRRRRLFAGTAPSSAALPPSNRAPFSPATLPAACKCPQCSKRAEDS